MFEVMFHWNFDDFFLQISKFLSKKYNRQRWKNSFFFKLKHQFFLSWELHRSKNRCRSKIYNEKFSHLFFFSFGSYSEFLRNILIHIDCSLSIQRSFWNFSLITCMFILFLIVFSCIIIPIERKKMEGIIHLHVLFYLLANISDYIYWTYSITRSFTQCNHIIS